MRACEGMQYAAHCRDCRHVQVLYVSRGRTCRSYRGRVSVVARQSFVIHVGLDETLRVWREACVRVYAPTADMEVISLFNITYCRCGAYYIIKVKALTRLSMDATKGDRGARKIYSNVCWVINNKVSTPRLMERIEASSNAGRAVRRRDGIHQRLHRKTGEHGARA